MGDCSRVVTLALFLSATTGLAQESSAPADNQDTTKEEPSKEAPAKDETAPPAEEPKGDQPAASPAADQPAAPTTTPPTAAPVPGTAPATPPKSAPVQPRDPDQPAPGEVRIRADVQEGEKGHFQARGSVDLYTGEVRIQADQLDMYEIEKPDGTRGKKVIAAGNVVFIKEDERLAGDRLTMDLDTGVGLFENARGYVEPGMLVEGKTIERIDANTYRVEGAKFTACTQPSPRWTFSASSAMVHVDDKVVGKNVVLRVKVVPAFYFPFFVYPIRDDQRSTGFLFPHFGNSSTRGFDVGTGFFWAMGRSADQTFYADHYSEAGFGFGHELRWRLPSPSRGSLRTYVFNTQGAGKLDYDINWSALQVLPGKGRLTLNARLYSSTLFQNRYQDNFNLATSRTESAQIGYQQALPFANFQVVAEDNRVFFSDQTKVNRRLPSLRLNRQPRKIGKTGIVFGFEARGERLGRGTEERLDLYSRFDFAPQISRPFTTTFLQVNPSAKYRYTYYGDTLDPEHLKFPLGPPLTRRFLEAAVELDGPTFSRVFDNPGGFYSNRFKHVIGPEVTWTYRTAVSDFDLIPKFDGTDQYLGTHEIYYSLVQRLLAKRAAANGKSVPFEFLSWRVGQTYYVKISENQNEFDPNYSTSYFGPGGIPDHNSPISSRLRVRPTTDIAGSFDVEYDVNFKQVRNISVGSTFGGERGSLTASWNKANKVAELPEDRAVTRNFVRGLLRFEILPKRLTFETSANYDLVLGQLLQSVARLRWDVQCCGFQFETVQFNYNGRDERQWRFNIELANMGSIGNFLGDQQGGPGKGPSGVGGMR